MAIVTELRVTNTLTTDAHFNKSVLDFVPFRRK